MDIQNNRLSGVNIAFLGDSITLGYGLTDPADRFSTLICKANGANEENYGITGTLMARAGMNALDGRCYVDRVKLVSDADKIVIFGGTNDYFWSDTPIFPPSGDESDAYFLNAVRKIFNYCVSLGKGKDTLIVTPYPHNGIGNFYGGKTHEESSRHDTDCVNYNGHRLIDYVSVLDSEAKALGLRVLNLHNIPDFDWKIHTSDGCHPNPEGHRWLAEKIAREL